MSEQRKERFSEVVPGDVVRYRHPELQPDWRETPPIEVCGAVNALIGMYPIWIVELKTESGWKLLRPKVEAQK